MWKPQLSTECDYVRENNLFCDCIGMLFVTDGETEGFFSFWKKKHSREIVGNP